jgi:protein TonB
MPLRKAPHADLRRSSFLRAQVAALLAVSLPLLAFTVDVAGPGENPFPMETPVEAVTVLPPPPTKHEGPKPPPPPRPPVLLEVPDETFIEDAEIVFEDEPVVSVPIEPPPPPTDEGEKEEAPETFVIVEQMPALLPNETDGMRALQLCIRYPEMAKRAGIQGRVTIQFVVDEAGNVTAPYVLRGIGGGADEEALRCVREARFDPGRQRGKPVRVQFSLPVTFRLR